MVRFTTVPAPPMALFGVMNPSAPGVYSSGPFSPMMYDVPAVTGPPSARNGCRPPFDRPVRPEPPALGPTALGNGPDPGSPGRWPTTVTPASCAAASTACQYDSVTPLMAFDAAAA